MTSTAPASIPPTPQKLNVALGVLAPALLASLPALVFVRVGFVVGHLGFLGFALAAAAFARLVFLTTASLSALLSNNNSTSPPSPHLPIALARATGAESGAVIGILASLARIAFASLCALSVADAWRAFAPEHPPLIVASIVMAGAIVIAWLPLLSKLEVVAQLVVVGFAAAGIGTVLAGGSGGSSVEAWLPALGAPYSLSASLALCAPLAAGVLFATQHHARLSAPAYSLRKGAAVSAAAIFGVFLIVAAWSLVAASPASLRQTPGIALTRSLWAPSVFISQAIIASWVAAQSLKPVPQTLCALAQLGVIHERSRIARGVFPFVFSAALALLGLSIGSFSTLSTFFAAALLSTCLAINALLWFEQGLNLPAFRPALAARPSTPKHGVILSAVLLLATSPLLGLLICSVGGAWLAWISWRPIALPAGIVRSALISNLVNRVTQRFALAPQSSTLQMAPGDTPRAWTPRLMLIARSAGEIAGHYRLLRALASPSGDIRVIALASADHPIDATEVIGLVEEYSEDGLLLPPVCLQVAEPDDGALIAMSVIGASYSSPSVIFYPLQDRDEAAIKAAVFTALSHKLGLILYATHQSAALGRERSINLWMSHESHKPLTGVLGNLDLTLLLAIQLRRSWSASLRVICATTDDRDRTREALASLLRAARVNGDDVDLHIHHGAFDEALEGAPRADLNILGLPATVDLRWIDGVLEQTGSSCFFVMASGDERALA